MSFTRHYLLAVVLVVASAFVMLGCKQTMRIDGVEAPVGTVHDRRGPSAEKLALAPLVSPFEVELVKKATWWSGRSGFDPTLPGFHLAGDIATIRLKPVDPRRLPQPHLTPGTLVFRLYTSPGMPPNVENLTISTQGFSLSTALSNGADGKGQIEVRRVREGVAQPVEFVPQSEYMELKAVDGAVQLRLLPAALKLLKDGGEIRWIDWYRG